MSFRIALLFVLPVFAQMPPAARLPRAALTLFNDGRFSGQLANMNPKYVHEEIEIIDHGIKIHYMGNAERESKRVFFVRGAAYDANGNLYPDSAPGDVQNYVMDASGNFYVFNQAGHPELRHSSVFDGAPVAGAGNIKFANHTVRKIDGDSGHYNPSQAMIRNVISQLQADGVDLSQLKVKGN